MRNNNIIRLCAIIAVCVLTFSTLMVSVSFTDTLNERSDTKAPPVEPTSAVVVVETVDSDVVMDDNPVQSSSESQIRMEKMPDDSISLRPRRPILPPPPVKISDDYAEISGDNRIINQYPDLEIVWFRAFEDSFHVVVMNIGNMDVTESFTLATCVTPMDVTKGDVGDWQFKKVDGLKAGERKTIGFWHSYLGRYEITAYADWEGVIDEPNRSNNVYRDEFDIPAPDLEIIWFRAFDTTLHVMVRNNGNKDITSNATLAICVKPWVDPTSIASGDQEEDWQFKSIGELKAGQSKTIGFYHHYPAGVYELTAFVDFDNDIRELDEDNNRYDALFEITNPDRGGSDTIEWQPIMVPPPNPLPIGIDV